MTGLHGLSASPDEVEVEYQASMTGFCFSIDAYCSLYFYRLIRFIQ